MRKRNNNLCIRLTPEEFKHFIASWQQSGLSKADFLMRLIDGNENQDETVIDLDFEPPKEF